MTDKKASREEMAFSDVLDIHEDWERHIAISKMDDGNGPSDAERRWFSELDYVITQFRTYGGIYDDRG